LWRTFCYVALFSFFSALWVIMAVLIGITFYQHGLTGSLAALSVLFMAVHLLTLVTLVWAVLEVSRYVSLRLDNDWLTRH
jgi:phosphotransferase system  glucose/maltose/N-acetylglucosamine-specific IIC component